MDPPKARIDQDAHNYTQSQAWTVSGESEYTHDTVHRDRSSLYSYRSRDILNFVRDINGRAFNTTNELYMLPTDQEEWTRLTKQHEAICLAFGGPYPAATALDTILAPRSGPAKAVLDLGCGTGIWAIQLAAAFQHVTFIGVDLAPCSMYSETAPDNYHFELDNVDLGLSHYFDQFDLVHARGLGLGISDYRKFIEEALLCLKPGGMLLFTELEWTLYGEDKTTECSAASDDFPNGSWMQRILNEAKRAAKGNGTDISAMYNALNEGLWSCQLAEPSSCRTASLYLPIGTENDVTGSNAVAESLRLIQELHRSLHRLLLIGGISQSDIEYWSSKADEEIASCRANRWIRYSIAWGRRLEKSDAGAQAPQPDRREATSAIPTPYSYFTIYETQEESLNAAKIRRMTQGGP